MDTEKDYESCAIALQAAARTVESYCKPARKPSHCWLLLGTAATFIEMSFIFALQNGYGLRMKEFHGVNVEVSKKDGNDLYCEGTVDFVYREDNANYEGFNSELENLKKFGIKEPFIDIINEDVVLIQERLTVVEFVFKGFETVPHFYDPDEGKVTLSLVVKARQR